MRQFLLIGSIWGMFVGYRTLTITQGLLLHPLDLLLWGYAFVAAAQGRAVISATPASILWFLVLSALSIISSHKPTPTIVSDFKSLLLVIPVFALVRDALSSEKSMERALRAFLWVAILISSLGIFEYHFPSIARTIPFFGNPDASYSFGGFYRAQFSFFGNPIATIIPVFVLALAPYFRPFYKKPVYYLIFFILIYSIYIGGYRSFWGAALASILISLWLNGQLKIILLIPILAFLISLIGLTLIPDSAVSRFLSAFSALDGKAELGESSGEIRIKMIEDMLSWDKLSEHVLGHGLGSAGWVHSDLLMIAYNSGLLTAFVLSVFLLRTFWQLYTFVLSPYNDRLARGLFSVVPAVLMIFLFQAFVVLPQLAVPLYFVMGLMYHYPKLQRRKSKAFVQPLSYNKKVSIQATNVIHE